MDRTQDFIKYASSFSTQQVLHRQMISPSPFIIKATEVHEQISLLENMLESCYESFVGYHRYLPSTEPDLTEYDRNSICQEIVSFISKMACEIQDLNRQLEHIIKETGQETVPGQFYKFIVSSLLSKLGSFTARSDKMQNEYRANSVSPYRLLSNKYTSGGANYIADYDDGQIKHRSNEKMCLKHSTFVDTAEPAPNTTINTEHSDICGLTSSSFAQRYVDEIAPISKLREYENVAQKHKDTLLKEAKILRVRFSEDMQESQKMERTVSSISSMITEFAQLIESQSHIVEVMAEVSHDATQLVKQTDEELKLTLERSQQHQWTMTAFIVGMAIILLIFHFLSA